jgi:hypothetical protein
MAELRPSDVFAPFSSDDLERLDSFHEAVDELRSSRFVSCLSDVGQAPTVHSLRRHPAGGGTGLLRTQHASRDSRNAVFAAVRRLRTEHEFGSAPQVCNILRGSTKRRGTDAATKLGYRIEFAKRRFRDAATEDSTIALHVTRDGATRRYETHEAVLELDEYGRHFHQNDHNLRRDRLSIPEPLLAPAVDGALRATAEVALALDGFVEMVMADPSLRLV